jgi:hypothetical protein
MKSRKHLLDSKSHSLTPIRSSYFFCNPLYYLEQGDKSQHRPVVPKAVKEVPESTLEVKTEKSHFLILKKILRRSPPRAPQGFGFHLSI